MGEETSQRLARIEAHVAHLEHQAEQLNGVIIEQSRQRFGEQAVRICKNHAKIACVWNDRLRLLLGGSMNLIFNPRFEQPDITEGGDDFDLVERIEEEMPILGRKWSNAEGSQTPIYERPLVKRGRCRFCVAGFPYIPFAFGFGRSCPSQTCPRTSWPCGP